MTKRELRREISTGRALARKRKEKEKETGKERALVSKRE